MVCDEPTVGKNIYKDSGLGKKKTILYNCQMYAYFTKDECTLDEARESMDVYLYTGEGVCECSGKYSGYSEWTQHKTIIKATKVLCISLYSFFIAFDFAISYSRLI